ncbi:uncharacterized protein PHACADRAFT_254996 [Phanerochaete carnosa HHB-10118-sp]|uniref:Uncharacterized protein n=1 Tax=Phanerochaete carnosa (strain HHB-10118-sp) TaxID=650164 RepID=K5WE50_PHACS|nr:uncharacterized protein PHACADRAFT_254996 [Phanerochaete carnosa HHB-10118-sp]EKM57299.1 hypothetical protein PHACADRAFT_254996 [Phanerochaete carnosa HHB-10118-sp]
MVSWFRRTRVRIFGFHSFESLRSWTDDGVPAHAIHPDACWTFQLSMPSNTNSNETPQQVRADHKTSRERGGRSRLSTAAMAGFGWIVLRAARHFTALNFVVCSVRNGSLTISGIFQAAVNTRVSTQAELFFQRASCGLCTQYHLAIHVTQREQAHELLERTRPARYAVQSPWRDSAGAYRYQGCTMLCPN